MRGVARVTIETSDGRRITGAVQGSGGALSVHTARAVLDTAIMRLGQRRTLGRIYEPIPGHCCVMPDYSSRGNGICMAVDLTGASIVGVEGGA